MLRDILAGNVVERARRRAALATPEDAFADVTHSWTDGDGYPRIVRQLHPDLVGFEMIVAWANNAAVENVTTAIATPDASRSRHASRGYDGMRLPPGYVAVVMVAPCLLGCRVPIR
jgi:hypothetical protein